LEIVASQPSQFVDTNPNVVVEDLAKRYTSTFSAYDIAGEFNENQKVYSVSPTLALNDNETSPLVIQVKRYDSKEESKPVIPLAFESEDLKDEYASYWFDQLFVLSKRTLINNLRNASLLRLQYVTTILLGLLLGLIFFRLDYDLRGTQDRLGVLFFLANLLTFSTMSSIDLFFQDRAIFVRERATSMYSTSAFFFTKTLCDMIPMRVIPAVILGIIPYYMITLHPGWNHVLTLLAVLVLLSIVATSLCFLVSTIAPSVSFANLLMIIFMLFNMLFGGFLINKANLPFFINWLKYTSFLNYAYEILCCNEFVGVIVDFNPVGVPIPPTPTDGRILLQQFDMDPKRVPMDYILLGSFIAFQLLLAYTFLRFFIKEKR